MFEMMLVEASTWAADRKAMVDEARDASLQRIGATELEPGFVLVLTWAGRVIPFAISSDTFRATELQQEYTIYRFNSFGGSHDARCRDIADHLFPDDAEREAAQMLAVEALLAWGGDYRGAEQPDGRTRVEHQGRMWTLGDFGMA